MFVMGRVGGDPNLHDPVYSVITALLESLQNNDRLNVPAGNYFNNKLLIALSPLL